MDLTETLVAFSDKAYRRLSARLEGLEARSASLESVFLEIAAGEAAGDPAGEVA